MLEKLICETPKFTSLMLAGTCGFYVNSMGLENHPLEALKYFFIGSYVPSLVFGVDALLSSYLVEKKRQTALCDLRGATRIEYHHARVKALDVAVHEAIIPAIMGAGWGIVTYSLGYCGIKFIDSFSS